MTNARRNAIRKSRVAAMKEWVRAESAPIKDPDVLFHCIASAVMALGLPESDAIWFYKQMQRDGWKFCGVPVLDPQDLVQNFYQAKHFLSQRIVA